MDKQLEAIKAKIAQLILQNSIVGFNFSQPITFKSGIKSPIYCDFRKCQAFPELMEMIQMGLSAVIARASHGIHSFVLDETVIVGVPTGAIPHAALVARYLHIPSAYIRPDAKAKAYGLGKNIEGASIQNKHVLLIEDLVSTSGSIVDKTAILREAGAKTVTAFSIFSYGMREAEAQLQEAGIELHSLLTLADLMPFLKEELNDPAHYALLEDWNNDPREWFGKHSLEFDFGFLTQLRTSAQKAGNIICLGADPIVTSLPLQFMSSTTAIADFFGQYFEVLESHGFSPAAFKPNEGYYRNLDDPRVGLYPGSNALAAVLNQFQVIFPGVPVILDAKRGDIGLSSKKYAIDAFDAWRVDATTVSPYMGEDSITPFTNYCSKDIGKGVYILVRTSNPGAATLQNKALATGQSVYSAVADEVIAWAKGKPGVGAVVGATSLAELEVIAKKFAGKDIPLLIPGVGKQGGKAEEVIKVLKDVGFDLSLARINSSSGLTHPWQNELPAGDPVSNWKDRVLFAFEEMLTVASV